MLASVFGWSHREMMDLPPRLLAAYGRLAVRLQAEDALVALDNQMTALATVYRGPGSANPYTARRAGLVSLAQGQGRGVPVAQMVRSHLERVSPESLTQFDCSEASVSEQALLKALRRTGNENQKGERADS